MIFSNSLGSLPCDIVFDNTPLKQVCHTKFLGVIFDNKLSWKLHIDNICKTISRNIGVINRLKLQLPQSSLLMLYSSLILPYLNYGLLVWGNTHQTYLEKILILQKRIIRIICNAPIRFHTDPLFFENNLLKIKDLYSFQLGQFMYQHNSGILPFAFHDMFLKNQSVHKYPTRHCDEFHLPLLRTFTAKKKNIHL